MLLTLSLLALQCVAPLPLRRHRDSTNMKLAVLLVSLLFLATTTPMIEAKKKPKEPKDPDNPNKPAKPKPTATPTLKPKRMPKNKCKKCKKCGCPKPMKSKCKWTCMSTRCKKCAKWGAR